jgi:hypothetical protein
MTDVPAQRPVRELSPDEIEQMLALHRLYLETEYHEGHRANFSSIDLTGRDFSGLNLRGIKMDRALLRGADFTAADLRGGIRMQISRCGSTPRTTIEIEAKPVTRNAAGTALERLYAAADPGMWLHACWRHRRNTRSRPVVGRASEHPGSGSSNARGAKTS